MYAVYCFVQTVVISSDIVQIKIHDWSYHNILVVKAKKRRYVITGVTNYQLEAAEMGLQ